MNKLIKHSIKKVSLLIIASTMAFSAWAVTLDQAKQQGLLAKCLMVT